MKYYYHTWAPKWEPVSSQKKQGINVSDSFRRYENWHAMCREAGKGDVIETSTLRHAFCNLHALQALVKCKAIVSYRGKPIPKWFVAALYDDWRTRRRQKARKARISDLRRSTRYLIPTIEKAIKVSNDDGNYWSFEPKPEAKYCWDVLENTQTLAEAQFVIGKTLDLELTPAVVRRLMCYYGPIPQVNSHGKQRAKTTLN